MSRTTAKSRVRQAIVPPVVPTALGGLLVGFVLGHITSLFAGVALT